MYRYRMLISMMNIVVLRCQRCEQPMSDHGETCKPLVLAAMRARAKARQCGRVEPPSPPRAPRKLSAVPDQRRDLE